MVGVRERGEQIRQFILNNLERHSADIVSLTCKTFDISRQAVNKHIRRLVEHKVIHADGSTRNRQYFLHPIAEWSALFPLDRSITEDVVWRDYIKPLLAGLPENVMEIWHYGVTEMFNNAIDHSNGENAKVVLKKTATTSEVIIYDNGEGIFKKIQRALELHDERHSVLELAKGKLTTDPANHSGEGIFFSSKMFDRFVILSDSVCFSHAHDEVEDWILEPQKSRAGTMVNMILANNASREQQEIFDRFTTDDDYGFTKTVVPVRLTQYGDDKLVSRSQAKRLLARVERFKMVIFDFNGVDSVGQAFADEVFRVFATRHPDIEIVQSNANAAVKRMIGRSLMHAKD